MPIYEYQCGACGHQLETIQKFSDAPLTECPACGKLALQKMLSAPAFQFKGSGWYQTDFKGMGKKKPSVGSTTAKDTSTDKPATEGKPAPAKDGLVSREAGRQERPGETKTEAAPAPSAEAAKPKPAA